MTKTPSSRLTATIAFLTTVASLALAITGAEAGDEDRGKPSFLSFAVGYYDVGRGRHDAAELRLEYRPQIHDWLIRPFAAFAATTDGSIFVGGGFLADIWLGDRVALTPSLAANYYSQGSSTLDLGYGLEFRSQLELAYRFDNDARLGLAFSHYSNASLGDTNPGVETLSVYFSLPIGK